MMKKMIAISMLSVFLMGCTGSGEKKVETGTNNSEGTVTKNSEETVTKNFEGTFQKLYIPQFASVVNGGTYRNATGNVFIRDGQDHRDQAIEVYPGSVYEPDLPAKLKEGYTAEITLEQVNQHAEQAKEIFSITTTNLQEANVKIPNVPGTLYRYTIKVRDANNEVKDIRYDPLYTTFDQYNMAMRVMKDVYKQDETITFLIENWGPNHLSYSEEWEVVKKQGNEWVKVNRQEGSNMMPLPGRIETAWSMSYLNLDRDASLLMPRGIRSFVLDRYDWEEGDYKLRVRVGSAKHHYTLEDTFRVE